MIDLDELKAAIAANRKSLVKRKRRDFEAEKRKHERERAQEAKHGGDVEWYDENPPEYDEEDELLGNLAAHMTLALVAIAERLDRAES